MLPACAASIDELWAPKTTQRWGVRVSCEAHHWYRSGSGWHTAASPPSATTSKYASKPTSLRPASICWTLCVVLHSAMGTPEVRRCSRKPSTPGRATVCSSPTASRNSAALRIASRCTSDGLRLQCNTSVMACAGFMLTTRRICHPSGALLPSSSARRCHASSWHCERPCTTTPSYSIIAPIQPVLSRFNRSSGLCTLTSSATPTGTGIGS
mmetsp:Transcript_720/g.2349  ORF Transcript_720/g.2349 Transcript_720/m.2349 type:complete len:211 (+) Transcript_720:451-1083(+)